MRSWGSSIKKLAHFIKTKRWGDEGIGRWGDRKSFKKRPVIKIAESIALLPNRKE